MERKSIVIARWIAAHISNKRGCELLEENKYEKAVESFTDAIRLLPEKVAFYYNKCFALMKLSRFSDALDAANKCVQLDPLDSCYVAHLFKSVCEVELKDFVSAAVTFQIVLNNDADKYKEFFDISDAEIVCVALFSTKNREKNFAAAVQSADDALQLNPRKLYSFLKATALVLLKNSAESHRYTALIQDVKEHFNLDSLLYRGLCHYYLGNVEKSMLYFLVAQLISSVNNRFIVLCNRSTEITLMKQSAKASVDTHFYRTAYDLYSAALLVDPENAWGNAKLYFNRSIVAMKTGNQLNAIGDCSSAIQLNNYYVKAYLRRAKLYSDLNMFQQSFDDYARVCDITNCDEYTELREKMKKMVQQSVATEIDNVVDLIGIPCDVLLNCTFVND